MPNRTVYVGDTSPDARWALTDKNGAITSLPDAESIDVFFIGKSFEFDGPGYAIDPPVTEGNNTWNVGYAFADGDTDHPDAYQIFIVVTLVAAAGGNPAQIETFDLSGDANATFTVKARPTTSP